MTTIFSVEGTNGGAGLQKERYRRLDVYDDHVAFVDEQTSGWFSKETFDAPKILTYQEIKKVSFKFPSWMTPGHIIISPKKLERLDETDANWGATKTIMQSGFAGGFGGLHQVAAMWTHAVYYKDRSLDEKIEKVCNFIAERIKEAPFASPKREATIAPQQRDVTSELLKLADLRDKGVLTEDEFLSAKQKLLNSL